MTVAEKQLLKGQLVNALGSLATAKAMAQAPIMTPSGPVVAPALPMICTAIEQLGRVVDQTLDKL